MIVVSKSAWHYRLYRRWYSFAEPTTYSDPKTLCGYFWSLVFIISSALGLALAWFVSRPVFWVWKLGKTASTVIYAAVGGAVVTAWAFLDWQTLAITTAALAGLCVFLVAVAGVIVFIADRRGAHKERSAGVPKEDRSPSMFRLLWTFLKARKQRVCPLIEVRP